MKKLEPWLFLATAVLGAYYFLNDGYISKQSSGAQPDYLETSLGVVIGLLGFIFFFKVK